MIEDALITYLYVHLLQLWLCTPEAPAPVTSCQPKSEKTKRTRKSRFIILNISGSTSSIRSFTNFFLEKVSIILGFLISTS
ncbi:unnamed protein product [Amoebophrya sp. A120]|nr:unnamed protein product [Amoebophrya sp. A120]|eukprot:GSA120T00003939001.1